jgi:hypothetical protein
VGRAVLRETHRFIYLSDDIFAWLHASVLVDLMTSAAVGFAVLYPPYGARVRASRDCLLRQAILV